MSRQAADKASLLTEAKRLGIDLVGVTPAAGLADAPEGQRPTDIMAAAKTVIVLGQRCLSGPANNRHWTSYTTVHDGNIARLDNGAYYLGRHIEEQYQANAVPVPAMTPYHHWDEEKQYAAGDLSHKHAAVAAGLGVIGKNSLLITPVYGNMVNLVSVITDLELPPDPIVAEELCPSGCRLCINACPAKALRGDGTVEQSACRSYCWTKLTRGFSVLRCWRCREICPANRAAFPARSR